MLVENQGMTLWYGTPDAPAPDENVQMDVEITIEIGIAPADINNKIEVIYRIGQGAIEKVTAEWLRHDVARQAQYFIARLPAFQSGDIVEYTVIGYCGGRQVPAPDRASQFMSRFIVNGSDPRLLATSIAPESLLAIDRASDRTTINEASPRSPEPVTTTRLRSEQYSIAGTIELPEGIDRARIEVQVFDRDLPSLEQRGATPQLLGRSSIDGDFRFRIEFTDEQFRRGEGDTNLLRRTGKISPNLSFRVFDTTGRELKISRVVAQNREYRPEQIIFNAPANLEDIEIAVEPIVEEDSSEYEKLVAAIAPVIADLPITELTDEDILFLVNELGLEQLREKQDRIKWLKRSALLARESNLPIEAFYGWGRTDLPASLEEIANISLEDLPSVLKKLISLETVELSRSLLSAIAENIIPASLRDRINDIMAQIERVKVSQGLLLTHQFIGKLLNDRTGEPLVGFRVQGFDLDSASQPRDLGQAFSNDQGVFSLTYITPPLPAIATAVQHQRRLRLEVLINLQTQEKFEAQVQAATDRDIQDVRVTLPAPVETPLDQIRGLSTAVGAAAIAPHDAASDLIPILQSKNINTLEALRRAGGIRQLENLPNQMNEAQIRLVESHTELQPLTNNVETSAALIDKGYDSLAKIAKTSRSDFVNDLRDRIGDYKAAELQVAAHAQTAFQNNLMFRDAANLANGLEANPLMAEQVRCSCQACEAAVSPLAYLTDLVKFTTENIKLEDNLITVTDLANRFHQPFDQLKASCAAVDTPIRQVRLCIEVLRGYLGTRPLADAAKEEKLAIAEKKYRLAIYTLLLTKIGTSFAEIRLAQSSDSSLLQTLADRLGIDVSHVKNIFLDPNAADPNIFTEVALEKLFGLVDTNRNPLSEGVKLGDDRNQIVSWNLSNFQLGVNTDPEGKIYVRLTKNLGTNVIEIELFQSQQEDGSFTKLVAKGEISVDSGTVKLLPENNSGLYGVFDIAYTADSSSISIVVVPSFLNWRLQHLRTLWKAQDWLTDAYGEEQSVSSQLIPIIDPDVIGPDDFRRPEPGNKVFDLWNERSKWVSDRLKAFAGMTKEVQDQTQRLTVPDIDAMLASMSQAITYSATSNTPWASPTNFANFEALLNQLSQGEIAVVKPRLQNEFNLTVESFTRLMAIAGKEKDWEADSREEKVSEEEWQEVYSILTQVQKVAFFATWRKEEQDNQVELGPESFWLSLTQPQEGNWPQDLPTAVPAIDPALIKLKDLPDLVVGEQAIGPWNNRQQALSQISNELEKELLNNGFDSMLKLALGDPLPNLDAINDELSNPDTVESATRKIIDLNLTIDGFKKLRVIRVKVGTTNKPTRQELAALYTILATPYKIKSLYPVWKGQESPLSLSYWQVFKAKLPRWRASFETRQGWLQALLNRSQSPLIDPDLIGPGDLKNPATGDLAFDLWKSRDEAISTLLTNLQGQSKDLTGLDANFKSTLAISVNDFLKVSVMQTKGETISGRLEQLSLGFTEFNYLLRIVRLLQQNQVLLDSEWENIYSVLVQVWKRRQSAKWNKEERQRGVFRTPDFFQIRPQVSSEVSTEDPSALAVWRAPRLVYLDWQDSLQTRIDQKEQTIQAYLNAINAAEEERLEQLRDALILAADTPNIEDNLEAKAKWITENLLVDAKTSSSITLTRVAQAIEAFQVLILSLRTGRTEELFKNLKLNQENFEQVWRWLGSYSSWRAAMFVFLYPENLLQPTLRKWQTPGFQALVNNIKSDRNISLNTIYKELKTYVQYFQDVIKMDIQATSVLRTRVSENYGVSDSLNYREFFYLFGINGGGSTDRIYWSAYDSKNGSSQAQIPWTLVQTTNGGSIKNFGNISRIIGAITHQKLQGSSKEYLYLFAEIYSNTTTIQSILYVKYDPEKRQWDDEATLLTLPPGVIADRLVLCQRNNDTFSPLRFIIQSDRLNASPIISSHLLDPVENKWLSDRSFTIPNPGSPVESFYIKHARIVNLFEVSHSALYIFISGFDGDRIWKLQSDAFSSPNVLSIIDHLPSIGRPFKIIGSFISYQNKMLGVLITADYQIGQTEFKSSLKLVLIDKDNFSNALSPLDGTGSILDGFYQNSSVDIGMAIPNGVEYSADNSSFMRIILSAQYNGFAIACIPDVTSDNKFDLKLDPSSAVPNDQLVGVLSLVKPFIKRAYYNIFNNDYYILPPLGLTAENLQQRREFIQKVVDDNSKWGISATQKYIKEAYYFAPLQIAIELQNKGEYLTALDIFRAFYDYTLDETSDQNARKIFYGFILESTLPLTYKRAQDWLLDPLDPHTIAETRQNSYLRFTLFSILRCLLEFADSEFTQDSAESNARARSLYLTAQELLESKELKQSIDKCDEVVGFLDDIQPDDPRWQFNFLAIRDEVNALPDLQTRRRAVPELQAALTTAEPIEQRLTNARAILDRTRASLAPASTLTQSIKQTENTNQLVQRSLMGDSALPPALDTLRINAQENLLQEVSRVVGVTPEQFQNRDFEIPQLRSTTLLRTNPSADNPSLVSSITSADLNLAPSADHQTFTANFSAPQNLQVYTPLLVTAFCIPANPLLRSLRLRTETSLTKLRAGLNIAGLKRQLESYSAPTDTTSGLPTVGNAGQLISNVTVNLQPTLYRYQVLIERAKQLVQLAAQIETSLLGAESGFLGAIVGALQATAGVLADVEKRVDKRFEKGFSLLKARQDLGLAQSGIKLQDLRLIEANNNVTLVNLQKAKAEIQRNTYQQWINSEPIAAEKSLLENYKELRSIKDDLAYKAYEIQKYSSSPLMNITGDPVAALGGLFSIGFRTKIRNRLGIIYDKTRKLDEAEYNIEVNTFNASYERRRQEWRLQEALAQQDLVIGDQQIQLANDRVGIVGQEKAIAELQTTNAKDAFEYLAGRITENPELTKTLEQTVKQYQLTAELYDYIRNVLQGVYRYFLQQATSTAKLAQNQLAFERQETPPTYIQSDYWTTPPSNADTSNSTNSNTATPDRQGLTGSARLLQDVYQLDQYAFNTNKRKFQLTKTLSLALLAPLEFQRFRETGVILFSTPMELFDRDFPGHYLRLIRRVRASVIALIPSTQGIHATLTAVGISRVVVGPDVFQTIPIRRDPEFVALTSPTNATGLFELESLQPDFLLPFEGNGVDSSWEFQMPKAANQFDYRTIADVLITIEYTALNSFDYRQQVIQTLDPNLSADRPFSFRSQFADQWYDLNNPDQTKTPMQVKFQTFREDFPPNVETLKIQQILLYFVRASQTTFELPITELRFTEQGNQGTIGGSATPIDGIISTRRGNAGSWTSAIGKTPVGEWELTLPNTEEVKKRFLDEELDDILFVITYAGRTPEWPA